MSKEKICVVGAGVVGQATGQGFIAQGYEVHFIDVNRDVVEKLKREGETAYLPEEAREKSLADVTLMTVSTPTRRGKIELSYLASAAQEVGRRLARHKKKHLVVVRSTIVPGTTEQLVIKEIEKASGKKAGRDFSVCYNPEYLREETAEADFKNPWVITIGQLDQQSGDWLERLYAGYSCPKYRLGIKEAELQKYVHNIFNATKISYFNEMRQLCQRLGVDAEAIFPIVAESCEGMWNAKYGIKNLGPYDGMCLPKDTQALYDWASQKGWPMKQLEATMEVNDALTVQEKETAVVDARQEVLAVAEAR